MSKNIVVITAENAREFLIDESLQRPVLIDFWADWCAPCKNLMPILEKLAEEYEGDFLLAKVNADEQQMIASQFGVRNLPTVVLMDKGQPVDGFTGALPESQIRQFLEKHLPSPWQKLAVKAQALVEREQFGEAISILQPAYSQSGESVDIAFVLAAAYLGCKRYDEAEAILNAVKMVDQNGVYGQLVAQLELAKEAKRAPEIEALEAQLASDPDNKELQFLLAVQYSQHGFQKEALEHLFRIIAEDINYREGEAKKIFMDVIAVMGKGDPVAVSYQRKLYTLLY